VAVPEDASLDQFASPEGTDSETTDSETTDPEETGADAEDGGADSEETEADTEEIEVETEDSGVETKVDDADSESADADSKSDIPDPSAVESAASTYRWVSEGGECADCGASAERLWRSAGQTTGDLVCHDCKEW
jgi:hypothetical protein